MTKTNEKKIDYMGLALKAAKDAALRGEVPIGAVVVQAGKDEPIAVEGNRTIELHDPSAHAEILALRKAGHILGNARLTDCDLYVSLEPCPMCAGAISIARIRRLYYAAHDEKGGGVESGARVYHAASCHHAPEIYGGIQEKAAEKILKDFFQKRR